MFADNGYYLYGEVMPVIPQHTCSKDKETLSGDSEGVIIGEENNSSDTTVDQADSSVWW